MCLRSFIGETDQPGPGGFLGTSAKKQQGSIHVHPWKSTWNPKMEVWKMIFLFNWVIFGFYVNFQVCRFPNSSTVWFCPDVLHLVCLMILEENLGLSNKICPVMFWSGVKCMLGVHQKNLVESTWLIQSINPAFLQLIIPNETHEESSKIQTCLRFALWKSLWRPWMHTGQSKPVASPMDTATHWDDASWIRWDLQWVHKWKNDGRRKRSLYFFYICFVH